MRSGRAATTLLARADPAQRAVAAPAPVLFVSHTGHWGGGAEVALLQTMAATQRAGRPVCLVCPPGELQTRARQAAHEVVTARLPRLRRTRRPDLLLGFAAQWCCALIVIARVAHRTRSRIIHANSGVTAIALAPMVRLTRRRLVWYQWDIVPGRRVNRAVLGSCGRLAALVIACSRAVADSLVALGVPATRIEVSYPRARDRFFEAVPKPRRQGRRPFVAAVVGRLVPRKAQDVFLEAAAILAREAHDIQCVILGDASGEGVDDPESLDYVARLRRLASQPELRDRVQFLGHRDDVAAILAGSDVLVMPSYNEPFGIVVLEALAMGIPVVACAAGGPLEVIDDQRTGLLVPPGDARALARAVKLLMSDDALRLRLARNGQQEARARFSEQSLTSELDAMFRRLESPAGG